VIGGVLLLLASVALAPGWPAEWLHAIRGASHFRPLLALPGGAVVLLALLRWRRPEARLLAVMACVPLTTHFYEALPALLVVRRPAEGIALVISSWIGFLAVLSSSSPRAGFEPWVLANGYGILLSVYLPALVIVLRRPNEGDLPAWAERLAWTVGRRLHAIRGGTSS
jgi:hypothetical protein